jgi:hypothetical protein
MGGTKQGISSHPYLSELSLLSAFSSLCLCASVVSAFLPQRKWSCR